MRVLGVVGSLRGGSYNRRLLHAAADELQPEAELVPFEQLKAVEPFDETDEREAGGGLPGADAFIAAIQGSSSSRTWCSRLRSRSERRRRKAA